MVNGKVYMEKSDGAAMSKSGAVAGQAADKPTMQKDANRLTHALKAILSGGGLGGDVAAETIENANAARAGLGKFTRLFGGNKFDDELSSAAAIEDSWMKALGDYTKDRSQWNTDRLEVASMLHDIQAERINDAYMNMLARRNLSVGGAGIGAAALGGSALLGKTASAGHVMEKLARVAPYVDYILSSGGMEKSAINVSKFVNGARGIAGRIGGYITGTGKDVAKGVEAYDKGIADITGRRQAIDEFMNNVVNNKVSKTAVDDLATKYGLNEAQQGNLRLFQKFHRGKGNYNGIEDYKATLLNQLGASDAQIAKHTRDLGRDFYKQYGRNAARNARAGRMAIGGTAAAGTLGVGGYALGHSNGVDSGVADFRANQLPQYLTRAATIGHMAAQNQANNAGFMDRLGYLFTGNSGSLNMNNPLQQRPSRTTGGFMA